MEALLWAVTEWVPWSVAALLSDPAGIAVHEVYDGGNRSSKDHEKV